MDMGNPVYYDTGSDYDFYERNNGRQGADGECLDGKRPLRPWSADTKAEKRVKDIRAH